MTTMSDHLIVAEMLNIATTVEELADDIGMNIAPLTMKTVGTIIEVLRKQPNSTIMSNVYEYINLNTKLS